MGAVLYNADLHMANLHNADLSEAIIIQANLEGSNLDGAVFENNSGLLNSTKVELQERGAIFPASEASAVSY